MSAAMEDVMAVPVKRDRWGRPLIVPPEGGRPVPYTRTSTLAKTLSDGHSLTLWKQRQTALGLASRSDLLAMVQAAGDDRDALNAIVSQAMEAAGSSSGANYGTALHSMTEQHDRGETVRATGPARADLDAYVAKTNMLKMLAVEAFVVTDEVHAAGTLDRLVAGAQCGQHGCTGIHVGDVKTGKDEPRYPHSATIQTSVYARGHVYSETEGRTLHLPSIGVCQESTLLIHLPREQGRCDLYWLNAQEGWAHAYVAAGVRQWRKSNPIRSF